MERRKLVGLAVLLAAVLTICGCAGVGKGVPAQPAVAVLILSTQGSLPPGSAIGGIDVTVNLPPGVTAKADKTGATMENVVVASGGAQGAPSAAKFTPAEGAAPARVRLVLVKPAGFGSGEFATLNLDIIGAPPRSSDFSTTGMSVSDTNGTAITGLTAALSLQLK
jgi:hypothetical protein